MKNIKTLVVIASLITAAAAAQAAGNAAAPMAAAPAPAAIKTDLPMAEGEIRKIDMEAKKIKSYSRRLSFIKPNVSYVIIYNWASEL